MKKGEIGTVISGTLRSVDLHKAFAAELRRLNEPEHERIFFSTEGEVVPSGALSDDDHEFWSSETSMYLIEELEEALNECAPDGCFFGAHYGDGADFGFWKHE